MVFEMYADLYVMYVWKVWIFTAGTKLGQISCIPCIPFALIFVELELQLMYLRTNVA